MYAELYYCIISKKKFQELRLDEDWWKPVSPPLPVLEFSF